jgi:hypothetical protein
LSVFGLRMGNPGREAAHIAATVALHTDVPR